VTGRDDWLDAVADVVRARAALLGHEGPVVGVGGHSHAVEETVHDGVTVVNPGSVTGVGDADPTMLTLAVVGTETDVTHHEA
jgi:hypothetical protein